MLLAKFQLNAGWCAALAVGFGAAAGLVDLTQSEVQPAALLVLVLTFLLGFAQPQRAWAWALIIGSSILFAHLLAALAGYKPPYPVEPNVFATLLALIPAFIGAYSGAAIRWMLHNTRINNP